MGSTTQDKADITALLDRWIAAFRAKEYEDFETNPLAEARRLAEEAIRSLRGVADDEAISI